MIVQRLYLSHCSILYLFVMFSIILLHPIHTVEGSVYNLNYPGYGEKDIRAFGRKLSPDAEFIFF